MEETLRDANPNPIIGLSPYTNSTEQYELDDIPADETFVPVSFIMAADAPSVIQQLDAQIEHILKGWNIYTTLIFIVLISYLLYPLFFTPEPDVHPMLLARQATASQVRQPSESAIFRSLEIPQSYPLKSGLNVKDPGAPKWQTGRDGDLRDVWKRALSGSVDNDGKPTGGAGKVTSVLGKEEVIEHSFEKLTAEIIAVGQHLQGRGGSRVAIYLPNSAELLVTFFGKPMQGFSDGLSD